MTTTDTLDLLRLERQRARARDCALGSRRADTRCAVAVAWNRRRIHVTMGSVNTVGALAFDSLSVTRAHTVGQFLCPSCPTHPRDTDTWIGECWLLLLLNSILSMLYTARFCRCQFRQTVPFCTTSIGYEYKLGEPLS